MSQNILPEQLTFLKDILTRSPTVMQVLRKAPALDLPNWYVGAGAITQTIWNERHGYPFDYGLKDCDLVYFDRDLSSEAQDVYRRRASALFASLPIAVELTNEARVHLWYQTEFGKALSPYLSTEDAISTWPTTATCVGVRYSAGLFQVFAPYGLDDLLGMIVRPNKVLVPRQVYEQKVRRWKDLWPKLRILAWADDE